MARVIDFHAEWCGPCKQQEPILEDLEEEYGDTIDFDDVDVDEEQDVASQYGVRSIPTIVIEDDDGNPVERFVGLTDKDQIEEALEQVA